MLGNWICLEDLAMRHLWVIALALAACQTSVANVPAGPPGYRQGFAEGCDSGYVAAGHPYYQFKKNPTRYAQDNMYSQGWNDGFATCKGQYDSLGP